MIENREKEILRLKEIKEDCECEEEVKVIMEERIEFLEQEQQRLKELAENEVNIKGLFRFFRRR